MIYEQNVNKNQVRKDIIISKNNLLNKKKNLVLNDKFKFLNLKFINDYISSKEIKDKSNSKSKKNKRTFYQFNELNSSNKEKNHNNKNNNKLSLLIKSEKKNKNDNLILTKLNLSSRNSFSNNFYKSSKNIQQNYFELSKMNKLKIRSLTNKSSYEKFFERKTSFLENSIRVETELNDIKSKKISIVKKKDFSHFYRASSEKIMTDSCRNSNNIINNYSNDLINNIKNCDIQNPEEQHFLCVNFQNKIHQINSLIN
jgi:hypothetical protein